MLTEPMIIAICKALEGIAYTVRVAMEGQTPAQREQLWQWYVEDVKWWRDFLGISKLQAGK